MILAKGKLTLRMLGKIFSPDIFKSFPSFLTRQLYEISKPFFFEKLENSLEMSSVESFT